MVAMFSINTRNYGGYRRCKYLLQRNVISWVEKRNILAHDITSRDSCDSFQHTTIFIHIYISI